MANNIEEVKVVKISYEELKKLIKQKYPTSHEQIEETMDQIFDFIGDTLPSKVGQCILIEIYTTLIKTEKEVISLGRVVIEPTEIASDELVRKLKNIDPSLGTPEDPHYNEYQSFIEEINDGKIITMSGDDLKGGSGKPTKKK